MKSYNFLEEVLIMNSINMNTKPLATIICKNCVIKEYDEYTKIIYNDKIQFNYKGLKMSLHRDCSERATL